MNFERKPFSFSIQIGLHAKLKSHAGLAQVSVSRFLERMIAPELDKLDRYRMMAATASPTSVLLPLDTFKAVKSYDPLMTPAQSAEHFIKLGLMAHNQGFVDLTTSERHGQLSPKDTKPLLDDLLS